MANADNRIKLDTNIMFFFGISTWVWLESILPHISPINHAIIEGKRIKLLEFSNKLSYPVKRFTYLCFILFNKWVTYALVELPLNSRWNKLKRIRLKVWIAYLCWSFFNYDDCTFKIISEIFKLIDRVYFVCEFCKSNKYWVNLWNVWMGFHSNWPK